MKGARAVPSPVRIALRPTAPRCYRHCKKPSRAHTLVTAFPGHWQVYSCPGGVVSVTSYAEWSNSDPTRRVATYLRRHTAPPSLVTAHDLRSATRHGPELGRAAERLLARSRPARNVRVVYWRVYPFQGSGGVVQRLFVCWRHGRDRPVFFASPSTARGGACPICTVHERANRRRAR